MENYHQLLRLTMEQGVDQYNTRTNKLCRALVGHQVQYDLRQGFPALTTRKLPFKNIVGELLGFFRGVTSAADFRALGCHFWDINANETPAWLASPYRQGHDSGRYTESNGPRGWIAASPIPRPNATGSWAWATRCACAPTT